MIIELAFPAEGDDLAAEHHYLLYGALSRVIPAFHSPGAGLRFAPIGGAVAGKGTIRLGAGSWLRVRLPAEELPSVLGLASARLRIGEATIRLGVPNVRSLIPAPQLIARTVTFKHSLDPERFLAVARQKLGELGVQGEPAIPLIEAGPRAGEPRRRIIRIQGKRVVGYALLVSQLTAEESVRLQELPFGGRTRMGCGFFLPMLPRA